VTDPSTLPVGYPADLERVWHAADGRPIRIRPLRPDDLDRELRFVAGLSEATRYLRLQYSVREVSREDAARLLDLDYHDRCAFCALVGTPPDEEIIGVSRYARIEGTDRAECAIVVADAWQGRGIGTELMRSLMLAARASGLRSLDGSTLAGNDRIQGWARRFGVDARTEPNSGGQVQVSVDLGSILS
jgi:acetyltransferase